MAGENEVVMGVGFPVAGVDQSCEFGRQPPGTTPSSTNCRAYDSLEERERGGSRDGLSKFIDERVNGASLIQHLTVLVDPTTAALPGHAYNVIPAGVPTTTLPGGSGHLVRDGGSGVQPVFGVTPVQQSESDSDIEFEQFDLSQDSLFDQSIRTVSFDNAVTNNSQITAFIVTVCTNDGVTVTVTNNVGAVYTQVGAYERIPAGFSDPTTSAYALSMWRRTVSSLTDDRTIKVTPNDDSAVAIGILEFSGVDTASPTIGSSGNTETGSIPSTLSTDNITVGLPGSAIVAAFTGLFLLNDVEPGSGFTAVIGDTSLGFPPLFVEYILNQSATQDADATTTEDLDPVRAYSANGLSLRD